MVAQTPIVAEVRHRQGGTADGVRVVDLGIVTNASATIDGVVVYALAPGEVVLRVQAMPVALVKRRLQAVILRLGIVGGLDYVPEKRRTTGIHKHAREGAKRITLTRAGTRASQW